MQKGSLNNYDEFKNGYFLLLIRFMAFSMLGKICLNFL